jgi:hypothetical protein
MKSLRVGQMTKLPLEHKGRHTPLRVNMVKSRSFFIGRPCLGCSPRPPDASPAIPPRVPQHRSFSALPDHVSTRRASGLGFVAQPSNLMVLWWTTANPACRLQSWAATLHWILSMTLPFFSCHDAAHTWSRSTTGPSSRAFLSLHSAEAPQG